MYCFYFQLPEVEIKDHPDTTKFELHQKEPPLVFTFKAHKESTKTAWLREIRQYASDLGKYFNKVIIFYIYTELNLIPKGISYVIINIV